jgi:hypothetical protein
LLVLEPLNISASSRFVLGTSSGRAWSETDVP